jgi:dTMP kinase
MTARPLFLSLDGLDGAGKSTQCRLLAAWLREQGRGVTECIDPGGTPLGRELREILLAPGRRLAPACEALLFMASRAQLVADVIRPALDAGNVVVSDRFLLANIVYQGHAGRLDVEGLRQAGRLSTGGLEPDAVFVLDLPLENALARRDRPADRVEGRPAEYHERVRQGFLAEAGRRPDRVVVVDAARPVEQVQQDLRRRVREMLDREG